LKIINMKIVLGWLYGFIYVVAGVLLVDSVQPDSHFLKYRVILAAIIATPAFYAFYYLIRLAFFTPIGKNPKAGKTLFLSLLIAFLGVLLFFEIIK
jgi:hypothetical protein